MRRRHLTLLTVSIALVAVSARADDGERPQPRAPFLVIGDTNAARLALDSAKKTLAAGDRTRAVREIQRILDHFGNGLILAEDDASNSRWVPAPEAARRLLENLPPDARSAYESEAVAAGTPILQRALENHDERRMDEVLTRFSASSVGLAAARHLAESAFEAGRPLDAASAIERALRFWPNDADLWLRYIDALAAARDARRLAGIHLQEGLTQVPTAEGAIDVAARLAAAVAATPAPPEREDWAQWGGGPDHARSFAGEPRLKSLRWSGGAPVRRREKDESRYFTSIDDAQQRLQRWEATSPLFPALADRTLVLSDGRGVSAIDLYSGRTVWSFPPPGRAPPGLSIPRASLKGRTNVDAAFAPAIVGDTVFATVEVDRPYNPRWLQDVEITTYLPRRALVALDAESGRLRWLMGGGATLPPALEGLSIAGPPAVAEGIVVVVGVESRGRHEVSLVAFDAEDGRLRWKRGFVSGQQELNLFGEPVKELYAGVPAVADGTVYASTGLGVIVAADLRTGETRWVAAYETIEIERVDLWFTTPLRFPVWGPSPPIVKGSSLVIAPPDGTHLCVYDRATGRLVWSTPADASSSSVGPFDGSPTVDHLLGVARDSKRDVVVVTGRTLKAFDLAKGGKPVWFSAIPDTEGEPAVVRGCGGLSKATAYVPTESGLARFSIEGEGRYLGLDPWPPGAAQGNVFPFPRVLVVAGRGSRDSDTALRPVQAFFSWEDVQRELDARRAGHPDDPRIVIEAADAYRVTGQWTKAQSLFSEAERMALEKHDEGILQRARDGLERVHRDRGDVEADAKHWLEAKGAYEAALERTTEPLERIALRLRIDRVLAASGADGARVRNLETLADEAGDERAVIEPEDGEVSARAAVRIRLAAVHVAAGRPAAAVDVLERVLMEDGDAIFPRGPARLIAKTEIARIVKESGDAVYRKHEEAAKDLMRRAESDGGQEALVKLLAVYPNAAVVPEALIRLADRQMEKGAPAEAAATLRRLLETVPTHALVPRALAGLARALSASGANERARAALSRLERRHGAQSFRMDGREWSGRQFAQAERQKLGAVRTATDRKAIEPPLSDAGILEVDADQTTRVLTVAGSAAAVGNVPVLATTGDDLVAIDPVEGKQTFRRHVGFVYNAAIAEDILVVSIAGELLGLDPATGAERWRRGVKGAADAMESVDGQVIALIRETAGGRARLLAIDPVGGLVVWDHDLGGGDYNGLWVGEDDIVTVRRQMGPRPIRSSAAVFSLLTGALRTELPLPSDGLDVPPRLANGSTLVVAGRDKGLERIDAWDLASLALKWRYPLPEAPASVIALVPRGDELVVLDFLGRLITLNLADGKRRAQTEISGGLALVYGTSVHVDDDRVTLMLQERARGGATLASFDRSTGKAVWVRPLAVSLLRAAQLHRSGRCFVVLLSQSLTGPKSSLEIRLIDAADGEVLQRLDNPALYGSFPSSILEDGCLVVAGQLGIGIYKGASRAK